MLCASFIVSSGVVKSAGEALMVGRLGQRALDARR